MIQTLSDIEELKARNILPLSYLQVIEKEFHERYEAESTSETITAFRLPHESCIYHLEQEEDEDFLLRHLKDFEYVETERLDGFMYFRIGVMNGHEMNLIYFLEDTLNSELEQWLSN